MLIDSIVGIHLHVDVVSASSEVSGRNGLIPTVVVLRIVEFFRLDNDHSTTGCASYRDRVKACCIINRMQQSGGVIQTRILLRQVDLVFPTWNVWYASPLVLYRVRNVKRRIVGKWRWHNQIAWCKVSTGTKQHIIFVALTPVVLCVSQLIDCIVDVSVCMEIRITIPSIGQIESVGQSGTLTWFDILFAGLGCYGRQRSSLTVGWGRHIKNRVEVLLGVLTAFVGYGHGHGNLLAWVPCVGTTKSCRSNRRWHVTLFPWINQIVVFIVEITIITMYCGCACSCGCG